MQLLLHVRSNYKLYLHYQHAVLTGSTLDLSGLCSIADIVTTNSKCRWSTHTVSNV